MRKFQNHLFVLACLVVAGCTTLGPMPGMTGINPVPVGRAGVEVQVGFVPGFFLSDTVKEHPSGKVMGQFSAMFEPGELLAIQGLSLGARVVTSGDGSFEPMVRYRFFLDSDERLALAFTGFGTAASGQEDGSSYEAIRGGLEMSTDVRLTPKFRWIELHLTAGASLTGIHAEGDYCTDLEGFGETCDMVPNTHAEATGMYGTVFIGAYLDFFRHTGWPLYPVRLGFVMARGTMPRVRMGEQEDTDGTWYSFGLNLITGLGTAESE